MTNSGYNRHLNKTVEQWVAQAIADGDMEFIAHPSCRVCENDTIRNLVNKLIVHSLTVPDILEVLKAHNATREKQGLEPITKDVLYRHRREHFDIQSPAGAVIRQIQENSAATYGQDWEEGVGTILNTVAYHQTMMLKGYETLVKPGTVVTPEQGAKSADKLQEIMDKNADQYDRARLMAEMGRIVDVMRTYIPSERWPEVQAVLRGEQIESDIDDEVEDVEEIAIDDSDPEE